MRSGVTVDDDEDDARDRVEERETGMGGGSKLKNGE